jgi:acetyl esterase/lipase
MADAIGEPVLNRSAPVELEEVRDIDYVGDGNPRHRLHLYLPADRDRTRPLPIVCYIHGGGWRSGEMEPANLVRDLAETGRYGAATISYRLSGEAIWPAQLHDCKAAIRWLHANAARHGLDPDRIGVWGISAGGHLATMLGVTQGEAPLEGDLGAHRDMPSRVACVVDWYGPTDLLAMDSQGSGLQSTASDSLPSLLVGGPLNERVAAGRSASPITYASADDTPLLLVHGTRDPLVPFEQSVEMFHAMTACGGTAALVAVQGAGHGGLGDRVTELCHQFIDSRLTDGEFEMTYLSVPGPGWNRTHPARQADTP